jgi:hypothetical protein
MILHERQEGALIKDFEFAVSSSCVIPRRTRGASCDNRLATARIAGYKMPTRDEGRAERGVLLSKASKAGRRCHRTASFAVTGWTQSSAAAGHAD